jgi:hypothetical protein
MPLKIKTHSANEWAIKSAHVQEFERKERAM